MSKEKKPFTTGSVLVWWLFTSFVLFVNFDIWFGDEKFWKWFIETDFPPMTYKWFWILALIISIISAIEHLSKKHHEKSINKK